MTARSLVRATVRGSSAGGDEGDSTLLAIATSQLGGNQPTHWIDFINDRALIAGVDVGTVSQIPSITGTLALSASGHLVSGASNGLSIPLTGVTYPLTVMVELVRNTDTGAGEILFSLDSGSADDNINIRFNADDSLRLITRRATANQSSIIAISGVTAPSGVLRIAGRVSTNDVQAAGSPLGTLGTQDTSATNPPSPTHMRVGTDFAALHTFTGYIRKIAILNSALADANLQACVRT